MLFIYVTLILLFFAVALWGMVGFHYVLQSQRKLNLLWERIGAVLLHRNELMGDLPRLWSSPDAPSASLHLEALQDLLAQDASAHWQDVQQRVALRTEIEQQAQMVLTEAQQHPAIANQQYLQQLQAALQENGQVLVREVSEYNKTVQIYNMLLQRNPNRFFARKLGLEKAPQYAG